MKRIEYFKTSFPS